MCTGCSRSTSWLPALMNSADRFPNHVIALEALCSPGFGDPRSDRSVITTGLPLHHPGVSSAGGTSRSRASIPISTWMVSCSSARGPAKCANVSLLVAISVNGEGYRQILGIVEGAKEDKAGWSAFLNHLKGRGLQGVELIISDACMGLVESAAEFFPQARWQHCMVHFYRNVFSHVPAGKLREVALMLKAIHAQEDPAAAQRKAAEVVARLHSMRLGKAAELVETAVATSWRSAA